MVNKTYAKEWLVKAWHDLDSANVLLVSGHYTDTIGYLYHQSIEKIYKSILASNNNPIIKTHNLIELNELTDEYFNLNEDDLMTLSIITTYHTKQRYPTMDKRLPTKEEFA
jgi:HEPN domain-containing protein